MQTSVSEIRPIAGANPIRPSFVLQRSAADDNDDDGGPDDTVLPTPWWAPAEESRGPGATGGLAAQGLSGATGASVQRSTADRAGQAAPGVTPWPAAVAGRPTVGAPVQRASGRSSLPAVAAPRAASAPATTAAQPAQPLSFPSLGGGTVVQTSLASTASQPSYSQSPAAGSGAMVQRDKDGAGMTPMPTAGQGSGGAGQTGQGGRSERDLDELAKALFGRIRTRLRNDLLQDREAAGFTFDNV